MQVKLNTNYAGPKLVKALILREWINASCVSAGKIIDVDDEQAKALIEGKFAVPVRGGLETAAVSSGHRERATRQPSLRGE